MVAMTSTIDTTSIRPGAGSRDSGTKNGASASSSTSTGTARRKTEPHQKCSRRKPPTIGPSADPAANPAAQTAMASRRSSRSVKTLRRIESVDGMSMAPKKPSAARDATSAPALGA